ncbi:MAG: hypothetical protein Q9198_004464 [Flavoplaca austrocitrina]
MPSGPEQIRAAYRFPQNSQKSQNSRFQSTLNDMAPPPQFFYRVQHRGSYTTYNPYNGFVSRGHYDVHPAELLNKRTVEAHLDWGDRSNQPSPFISVFDNYGIASLRNMPTLTLIFHPDMPTTERATMYSGEIAESSLLRSAPRICIPFSPPWTSKTALSTCGFGRRRIMKLSSGSWTYAQLCVLNPGCARRRSGW